MTRGRQCTGRRPPGPRTESPGQGEVRAKPPVWRSASPSTMAAASATLRERAGGASGITMRASAARCTVSGVGGPVHGFGHAGALAADQQPVARAEGESGVGLACAGGQQHQPRPGQRRPEGLPGAVTDQIQRIGVIHDRPAQPAIVENEAGRLDQIEADAQAGGQTHHRAGVLGDVGLEQDQAHGARFAFGGSGRNGLHRYHGTPPPPGKGPAGAPGGSACPTSRHLATEAGAGRVKPSRPAFSINFPGTCQVPNLLGTCLATFC